jgi:Zn-dependent protease
MGWQDRDYNAGREEMMGYFANPAGFLQLSIPVYRSASFYVRLHFWFLLIMLFDAVDIIRSGQPSYFIPMDFALLLGACLFHELGHMLFARRVGGNHWEWVLWPLGGMVPPHCARKPKSIFVSNIGGVVFSLVLVLCCSLALALLPNTLVNYAITPDPFNPVRIMAGMTNGHALVGTSSDMAHLHALCFLLGICAAMVAINLFPAFSFDGGLIWQSILWPKLGQRRATIITCTAGMILAVPLFCMALFFGGNLGRFMGMVVWALIFANCFQRRQAAAATPVVEEDDDNFSYNYMDTPEPRPRKKRKKHWFNQARKRALADQAEQAKIDAILAKVKEKGLHSLTWWEKRTLRKATARQRQQDLVGRL